MATWEARGNWIDLFRSRPPHYCQRSTRKRQKRNAAEHVFIPFSLKTVVSLGGVHIYLNIILFFWIFRSRHTICYWQNFYVLSLFLFFLHDFYSLISIAFLCIISSLLSNIHPSLNHHVACWDLLRFFSSYKTIRIINKELKNIKANKSAVYMETSKKGTSESLWFTCVVTCTLLLQFNTHEQSLLAVGYLWYSYNKVTCWCEIPRQKNFQKANS